ncbi:hypothetical protein LXA43DRAFT_996368, partial [Ganoderma leucocontextum]
DIDVNVSRLATAACCGNDESSLPPLPALPSPLCCPHGTFLACLILASKFMQDRSYSNRAWAKLAGLPPREIGRCERALGDALEWRLWVGKIPASSTSTSGMSSGRTVTRSRSDGDVVYTSTRSCTTPSTAVWTAPPAAATATSSARSFLSLPPPPRSWTGGLSCSATVPAVGADCGSTVVDPFLVHGSEDRTIHMSMFLDLPTPAMLTFGNNPGPWVASAFTYTPADPANPHGSFGPINAYTSYFNPSNPTYAADMEATEASIGSTPAAFNPTGTKQVSHTLPLVAEVFSNPGMFENGTQ